MSDERRISAAKYLLCTSTHFAPRDWNYTRKHGIDEVVYVGPGSDYDRFSKRLARALEFSFWGRNKFMPWDVGASETRGLRRAWAFVHHVYGTFRAFMARDKNVPDGVLDGGNVITFWEETGEYLQVVQPSVGELVANFLLDEPENPHAILIADEISRILKGYGDRIDSGEVE